MNHWSFIVAAYAVTFGFLALLLLQSWRSMRRAEAKADSLTRS